MVLLAVLRSFSSNKLHSYEKKAEELGFVVINYIVERDDIEVVGRRSYRGNILGQRDSGAGAKPGVGQPGVLDREPTTSG